MLHKHFYGLVHMPANMGVCGPCPKVLVMAFCFSLFKRTVA
jgi:hypothetical protein